MSEETAIEKSNEAVIPGQEDNLGSELDKIIELVNEQDLMKALIGAYNQSDGQFPEYSGYVVDPNKMISMRLGSGFYKWSPTEDQLYNLAESTPIVIEAMTVRETQIRRNVTYQEFTDKLGWRIVHRDHDNPRFKEESSSGNKIRYLRSLFEKPHFSAILGNTFATLLSQIINCNLTVDKIPIELLKKGKRIKGMLVRDPRSIRPIMEVIWHYKKEKKEDPAAISHKEIMKILEVESERFTADTGGADLTKCEYVQYYMGRIVGAWPADEMIVCINHPSVLMDRKGFGTSRLEKSILALEAWIQAWGFNQTKFKSGMSMAKGLLALVGNYSDKNIKAFKKQLIGQISEVRVGNNLPVFRMPTKDGIQYIRLDPTQREMDFMQWLDYCTSIFCGTWGMDPQEMNLASRAQAVQTSIIGNNQEGMLTQKKDLGLYSLLLELKHAFDLIIKDAGPDFEDYRFVWTGLDQVATEKERIEILKQSDFLSNNEKRVAENKDPVKYPVELAGVKIDLADVPGELRDILLRFLQAASQEQQQSAMMEQGGEEEPEGAEEEKPENEGRANAEKQKKEEQVEIANETGKAESEIKKALTGSELRRIKVYLTQTGIIKGH